MLGVKSRQTVVCRESDRLYVRVWNVGMGHLGPSGMSIIIVGGATAQHERAPLPQGAKAGTSGPQVLQTDTVADSGPPGSFTLAASGSIPGLCARE